MNFIRKLKLNSLGQYEFTEKEYKDIYFIKELFVHTELNFEKINHVQKLINLNNIKYTKDNEWICFFDNEDYLYFLYNIKHEHLYWDHDKIEIIFKNNYKLTSFRMNFIIEILFQQTYGYNSAISNGYISIYHYNTLIKNL